MRDSPQNRAKGGFVVVVRANGLKPVRRWRSTGAATAQAAVGQT
jgi:hypothetical protein